MMEFLIVLAVLAVLVFVLTGPLRRAHPEPAAGQGERLAELEAARAAKLREIRDAELDHATGKLSDADHAAVDGRLRAEAVEILRAIDAATGESPRA